MSKELHKNWPHDLDTVLQVFWSFLRGIDKMKSLFPDNLSLYWTVNSESVSWTPRHESWMNHSVWVILIEPAQKSDSWIDLILKFR